MECPYKLLSGFQLPIGPTLEYSSVDARTSPTCLVMDYSMLSQCPTFIRSLVNFSIGSPIFVLIMTHFDPILGHRPIPLFVISFSFMLHQTRLMDF